MINISQKIKQDLMANVQNFEYLVNINDEIFVATRKQMLQSLKVKPIGEDLSLDRRLGELYYDDVGLKVSNISDRIDLKSSKPQLSSTSISFDNFNVFKQGKEERFSDQFNNITGKIVKVYFKTQSCTNLSQCLLLGQFKITRVTHDSRKIKITANDLSVDSLLGDIPKAEHILLKGRDTFDTYNLRPVPTLYGHLQSAPAPVYLEKTGFESYQTKLIPDTSYFDDTEIGGVAKFDTDGKEGIILQTTADQDVFISRKTLQLVRQNNVQVGLDDQLCDVPCLPYDQTRDKIQDEDENDDFKIHHLPQWFAQDDHVVFNLDLEAKTDEAIEDSTLWLSINEKPLTEESMTYHIRSLTSTGIGYGQFEGAYSYSGTDGMMNNVSSPFNDYEDPDRPEYKVGVQRFKFKPLSGYDIDDEKSGSNTSFDSNHSHQSDPDGGWGVKTDVHFVGSVAVIQFNALGGATMPIHGDTLVHAVYSSPVHDDDAVDGDSMVKHVGFPASISKKMTGGTTDDHTFDSELRRSSLMLAGFGEYDSHLLPIFNYRTSFVSPRYNPSSYNAFVSRYTAGHHKKYPTLDSSVLTLYYFINNLGGGGLDILPETRLNIQAMWRDLQLRRVWRNKQVFKNDFFLNAKGKLGAVEEGVRQISGHIVVKYEGQLTPNFSNTAFGNREQKNNMHFTELYSFLTNPDLKTKSIGGEIYDLMLKCEWADGQETYVYDVEVENLSFHEGDEDDTLPYLHAANSNMFRIKASESGGDININHDAGWVMKINAKAYGISVTTPSYNRQAIRGFRLVYAKRQYEGQEISEFNDADVLETDELDAFNNFNGYFFGDTDSGFYPRGYSFLSWDQESESKRLLERPYEIIEHLLLGEESAIANFDQDKINEIIKDLPRYKFAFSLNERINKRDVIQKICEQSPLYYRYRGRDKKVVIEMIKSEYHDEELSGVIDVDKAIRFSYNKTEIDDSCMGGVVVNYSYNYATENYDKRTPTRDAGGFKNDYLEYYGIDEKEFKDYEFELDAPYIQDKGTAELLRDYYFELNKHPHLVCDFELPTSEGIQYEVGDIIRFNKSPNNTDPYGKGITTTYAIIDQDVTPYFFITSVSKSLFSVKIKCIQTHRMSYELPPVTLLGDINLDGQITTEGAGSDLDLLIDMTTHGTGGYTTQQIANADMNGDGNIDQFDLIEFIELYGGSV